MNHYLTPKSDLELSHMINEARQLTRQRFGRTVQLYAPLYLSNECVDTCTYCGFSRENAIERTTLSPEKVASEARILSNEGFRQILLVAGEHPKKVSPEYLGECLEALHFIPSVSIEVAPFESAVYTKLKTHGLDGVVIYQETYQKNIYESVHRAGPKKSYEHRLLTPEEAAKAGIRTLGMGILLGLAPWQKDTAALIDHVRQMKKKYPDTDISVSLPRLKPCASAFDVKHPVDDRTFVQIIAAIRLSLPDVPIVLSTRESPALRDALIDGGIGVTRMSAGSRTEPGGYSKPDAELKQFEIEDHRSPTDVAQMITHKGYDAVWKDWVSPPNLPLRQGEGLNPPSYLRGVGGDTEKRNRI